MDQLNTVNPFPVYLAAPVNWYAQTIALDTIWLANEQIFEKQTLRNRIHYGSFQGTKMFTIPLVNSSLKKNYHNVLINYTENWQNHLINALQTSYGKSPFYEFYGYRFENIIRFGHESLWDFNMEILKETFKCLKINKPLNFANAEKATYIENTDFIQYYQVFQERTNFQPSLTILDLIFNEGPDSYNILIKINKTLFQK